VARTAAQELSRLRPTLNVADIDETHPRRRAVSQRTAKRLAGDGDLINVRSDSHRGLKSDVAALPSWTSSKRFLAFAAQSQARKIHHEEDKCSRTGDGLRRKAFHNAD
jgi:hypothetical protein